MANPRKFSEKIALHTHRQAEETARFEQIMREVSDVTARDEAPSPSSMVRQGRARSPGGPIRRPHERRPDTSPYGSNMFLSPPHDTSWRRTHSDSALHQSTMQDMNQVDGSGNRWIMSSMNGPDQNDGRPKSSYDLPRVPGIHIYPSAHVPGTVQIPISGNNTGSLPDLTNVDFSSPIHIPLDQDPDTGSSPYSSSPVNTSPSTLSPTSIHQGVRQQGRFHFAPAHSNHLSVPVNSRYQPHHNKNIPIDNKTITSLGDSDFTQLTNMTGMYQQQQQQPPQQQQQHCPPTSPSPTLQQASGYRSPRPSPQSSPSLAGRHSAPCSPGAPSPLPNDYNIFNQHQATQFQQHFEQLSMVDTPISSMSYVDQTQGQMTQSHPQTLPEVSTIGNIELTSDNGYYSTSPSQLVYPTAPPSLHTTPNTPNSIPDIILTDFSSSAEDAARQEINKQLDLDLFEESLRENLEPLDFNELQMLSDTSMNLISDSVEDSFKTHRS